MAGFCEVLYRLAKAVYGIVVWRTAKVKRRVVSCSRVMQRHGSALFCRARQRKGGVASGGAEQRQCVVKFRRAKARRSKAMQRHCKLL